MPKPPSAPLDYLAREFSEAQSLRSGDPELYRLVEQGLRSVEGARWVEVADALRYATGGWAVFFQDTAKRDRRALCWLVAAARHEHWISGVNHAIWLRSMFRKIPDAARHLAEMERESDPWLSDLAGLGSQLIRQAEAFNWTHPR